MAVNTTGRTYRDAGVDLDKAAAVKERIKSLAASALGPGVVGGPGFFGGVFDPDPAGNMLLVASTDSVGTKVRIAQALGRYDTLGHDIVNHCINDILPAGASPLFFLDYIGVGELEEEMVAGLIEGLADACSRANCSLLGGETATLAGIYEAGDFDLVGFIVGAVERDRLLTPDGTRPGDVLLGLPSSGLHTNGYSLVRSVFDIDENPAVLASPVPDDGRTLGDALLAPHRQYLDELRPVLTRIKGLAHITGGSFYKNVPRSLAPGLSAEIDVSTWTVPPLFRLIESRGVDTGEMFRVFNMGVGMAIVIGADDAESVRQDVPGSWELGRVVEQTGADRVSFVGDGSERLS